MQSIVTPLIAQQVNAPWEAWQQHPCYKGLSISVRNYGYNKDNNAYYWGVRIQNNYSKAVKFSYLLSVGDEKENATKNQYQPTNMIKPGAMWIEGGDVFTAIMFKSNSKEWVVKIGEVCFEGMNCGGSNDCYADCDITEKKINQPCGLESNAKPTNETKENDEQSEDIKTGTYNLQGSTSGTIQIEEGNGGLYYPYDGNRFLYKEEKPGVYVKRWKSDTSIIFYLRKINASEFCHEYVIKGKVEEKKCYTLLSTTKKIVKEESNASATTCVEGMSSKWGIDNHYGKYLVKINCQGDIITLKIDPNPNNLAENNWIPAGTIVTGKRVSDYYYKWEKIYLPAWKMDKDPFREADERRGDHYSIDSDKLLVFFKGDSKNNDMLFLIFDLSTPGSSSYSLYVWRE